MIPRYVDSTSFWKRSAEQLTTGNPTCRPYENLWRSPTGQSLDSAITGCKYPVHSHFRGFLQSTGLFPRGETLLHFPLIIILELSPCSEDILRLFQYLSWPNFLITSAKIFKDFFACKIVLAANHQYLGNIQKLLRQTAVSQQQPAVSQPQPAIIQQAVSQPQPAIIQQAVSQPQPAAATSSSNQQQQPAAATNSSNQQQQPAAAATSSSNQQQQPAAATSNSNLHSCINQHSRNHQHSSYKQHLHGQCQPLLVIITVAKRGHLVSIWPKTSCTVAECNHRREALFVTFSVFPKFLFFIFFLFSKT